MLSFKALTLLLLLGVCIAAVFQRRDPLESLLRNKARSLVKYRKEHGAEHLNRIKNSRKHQRLARKYRSIAAANNPNYYVTYEYKSSGCSSDSAVSAFAYRSNYCFPVLFTIHGRITCESNGGAVIELFNGYCGGTAVGYTEVSPKLMDKCTEATDDDWDDDWDDDDWDDDWDDDFDDDDDFVDDDFVDDDDDDDWDDDDWDDDDDDGLLPEGYFKAQCSNDVNYGFSTSPAVASYYSLDCQNSTRFLTTYYRETDCTASHGESVSVTCDSELSVVRYTTSSKCTGDSETYEYQPVDTCTDIGFVDDDDDDFGDDDDFDDDDDFGDDDGDDDFFSFLLPNVTSFTACSADSLPGDSPGVGPETDSAYRATMTWSVLAMIVASFIGSFANRN